MSSLIIALFYQHDHRIVLFAQVEQGGDGGIVFGFGVCSKLNSFINMTRLLIDYIEHHKVTKNGTLKSTTKP